MVIWISTLLFLAVASVFWFYRQLLPVIVKSKAHGTLHKVIFPKGEIQKQDVLKTFHSFTKHRFTDDQILDYFLKIKGLQNLSLSSKTDFWVRKYLLSPTKIKLNYFEQVKFYELFMNFPISKASKVPLFEKKDTTPFNLQEDPIDKIQTEPALKQESA